MTLPTTMRAIEARAFSIDALALAQRPVPTPRRGEIVVRVRAASLNYRDLAILCHGYMPSLPLPYVPSSDAAGEVVAVGEDVSRFKVGDRVVPVYTQGWYDGMPTQEIRTRRTLGAPLTGVLQEYVAVPAEDAIATPDGLTDAEASTLPIAAVTAWSTLQEGGLKPGDTVLVQGTGGVALFGLQFAKAAGARVIILSSSDEKLARAAALGADVGINYRSDPEWDKRVRDATGGRGVDIVIETVGSSLARSLAATAFGGFVGVVGFVGGLEATISPRALLGPMIRVQGIATGPRSRLEALGRAIRTSGIKPVVDARFALEDTADAFRRMERGAHFGKIVIELS
jgi:NADPH:quinone reductase-like Zn-dependent oxidoreductase